MALRTWNVPGLLLVLSDGSLEMLVLVSVTYVDGSGSIRVSQQEGRPSKVNNLRSAKLCFGLGCYHKEPPTSELTLRG